MVLFAGLALAARSAVDLVALWRATVLALAYVPGRVVAMSDPVEELTLYGRRSLAPYAVLIAWGLLLLLWLHSVWSARPGRSGRSDGSGRSAGSGRSGHQGGSAAQAARRRR